MTPTPARRLRSSLEAVLNQARASSCSLEEAVLIAAILNGPLDAATSRRVDESIGAQTQRPRVIGNVPGTDCGYRVAADWDASAGPTEPNSSARNFPGWRSVVVAHTILAGEC